MHTALEDEKYLGDDQEWLAIYAKEILQKEHFDYFIFGHRHLPIDLNLTEKSRYVNLGEWINYRTYAVFHDGNLSLEYWEKD